VISKVGFESPASETISYVFSNLYPTLRPILTPELPHFLVFRTFQEQTTFNSAAGTGFDLNRRGELY